MRIIKQNINGKTISKTAAEQPVSEIALNKLQTIYNGLRSLKNTHSDSLNAIKKSIESLSLNDTDDVLMRKVISGNNTKSENNLSPYLDIFLSTFKKPSKQEENSKPKGQGNPKGIVPVPKFEEINFSDADSLGAAMSNLSEVVGEFQERYSKDPNKEQHFEKLYNMGVEAGKNMFLNNVVSKKGESYYCDNPNQGIENAKQSMALNIEKSKKLLVSQGLKLDSILNFARYITYLLCIYWSETSSNLHSIEEESEKYINALNNRFPLWKDIGDYKNLTSLMQKKNSAQDPGKQYKEIVEKGSDKFLDEIVGEQGKYIVTDINGGQLKAKAIMEKNEGALRGLATMGNVGEKSFLKFVELASFILCVANAGITSNTNSPKALSTMAKNYLQTLGQLLPNYFSLPDFKELSSKLQEMAAATDPSSASETEIQVAWDQGITKGLQEVEKTLSQDVSITGDKAKVIADGTAYMKNVAPQVSKYFSTSKTFNAKSVQNASFAAIQIYILQTLKAVGQNGKDIKAQVKLLFETLDRSWDRWFSTGILDVISQFKASGGYGYSLSPEKAFAIWKKLSPKAIEKIRSSVAANPALKNHEGFKYLFSNPWSLTKPKDLESAFGRRLIYAENIVQAKEAISAAAGLRGSSIDASADYLLNRVAAWCSSMYDYDKLDPYNKQNLPKEHYPVQQNQPNQPNQQKPEPEVQTVDFEAPADTYSNTSFISTISATLAVLFSIASEQGGLVT